MSFIHLSDIHLCPELDGRTSRSIRESLPEYIEKNDITATDLVVTGDFRNARMTKSSDWEQEAAEAVSYIESIARAAGIPPSDTADRVHIVPGNHDLDRSRRWSLVKKVREAYDSACGVIGKEDLEELISCFGFFECICGKLYGEDWTTAFPADYYPHTYRVVGDTVWAYLNTALTHHSDDARRHLVIENSSLDSMLKAVREDNPDSQLIVLAHHAPEFFSLDESRAVMGLLVEYGADLYLCGDAHESFYTVVDGLPIVTMGCIRAGNGVDVEFCRGDLEAGTLEAHRWERGRWAVDGTFDRIVAERSGGIPAFRVPGASSKSGKTSEARALDEAKRRLDVVGDLLEQGQFREAAEKLRNPWWRKSSEDALERRDAIEPIVAANIRAGKMLADALLSGENASDDVRAEAESTFRRAASDALRCGVELGCALEWSRYLGKRNKAEALAVAGRLAHRLLAMEDPDLALLCEALCELGDEHYGQKHYADAIQSHKSACDAYRRRLASETWMTSGGKREVFDKLSSAYRQLSRDYWACDDIEKQVQYLLKAMDARVRASSPGGSGPRPQADELNRVGTMLRKANLLPDAEWMYRLAIGALAEEGDDASLPYRAMYLNNLGICLSYQRRFGAAMAAYDRSYDIRDDLAGREPEAYENFLLVTVNNRAMLLSRMGQYEDADRDHERVVARRRELSADNMDHVGLSLAYAINSYAVNLVRRKQGANAVAPLDEALAIKKRVSETSHEPMARTIAETMRIRGASLADVGTLEEAMKAFESGLSLVADGESGSALNPMAWEFAQICDNAARVLSDAGDFGRASDYATRAVSVWKKLAECCPWAYLVDLAACCKLLAEALRELGWEEAAGSYSGFAEEAESELARMAEVSRTVPTSEDFPWRAIAEATPAVIASLNPTNPEQRAAFLSEDDLERPTFRYGNIDVRASEDNLVALNAVMDAMEGEAGLSDGDDVEVARYLAADAAQRNLLLLCCSRYSSNPSNVLRLEHRELVELLFGWPGEDEYLGALARTRQSIDALKLNGAQMRVRRELNSLLGEDIAASLDKDRREVPAPSERARGWMRSAAESEFGLLSERIDSGRDEYSPAEACEVANWLLEHILGPDRMGWRAVVAPDRTFASASSDERLVRLPAKRAKGLYTPHVLRALLVHEVGVHVQRSASADGRGIPALREGLPGYLPFEEGVAKAFEQALCAGFGEREAAGGFDDLHLVTIGLACLRGKSFREVFEITSRLFGLAYGASREVCFDSAARCFRGTGVLPITKDLAYTRGLRAVWSYIDEHADDPDLAEKLLRRGKIDLTNPKHVAIASRAFG